MDRVECLVIGAGVVGLAVARALGRAGIETVIAEKAAHFGTETSARNSEVIHAGIYYPEGSLKARACVAGRDRLYAYCAERGVPHSRCGKLIVAGPGQQGDLERIEAAARANGVDDIRRLSGAEARAMEPEVLAEAALFSPSTGVIDSHAFMLSLLGEAEDAGVMVAYGTEVQTIALEADGLAVTFAGEGAASLKARRVVNSAGLGAVAVAQSIAGLGGAHVPPERFAKGVYFTLTGRSPFTHLVYPIPEPGGLGVHVTLDMGGQARFGPDVEWVDAPDYDVDPARAEKFYAAIRAYWPNLKDGALAPGYAGVRPKVTGPGEPAGDFIISGPAAHGVAGLINLFGIESPGLTASLVLADEVVARLRP